MKTKLLLAVLAIAIGGAVYFSRRVANIVDARTQAEADVASGAVARRDETPSKPAPEPPLGRSTSRTDEVLVLTEPTAAATRPADVRRIAVLLGNGEFLRRAGEGERGPLASSILDRSDADRLLRATLALPESATEGPLTAVVHLSTGAVVRRGGTAAFAPLLAASGRQARSDVIPRRLGLSLKAAAIPENAPEWPARLPAPESFLGGSVLAVPEQNARSLVEALLAAGANFRSGDAGYAVVDHHLIPPP